MDATTFFILVLIVCLLLGLGLFVYNKSKHNVMKESSDNVVALTTGGEEYIAGEEF
jgi:hypothetical protein